MILETELRPLTINAGLEVHTDPLDRRTAAHLLRRTGFGAAPDQLETLIGASPEATVDALVDAAIDRPLPERPDWYDTPLPARLDRAYFAQNSLRLLEYRSQWIGELIAGGLREKMALFWHNHFVTDTEVYVHARLAYGYLNLIRKHALGDFKQFVYDMGLNLAMLIYLDGTSNTRIAPNENYARELLELFTTSPEDQNGQPNYTEADIREMARALTGYVADLREFRARFFDNRFDDGEKTFLGRTGAFRYADVVDIVFEERTDALAHFICAKLYKAFVYAAPAPEIVDELAEIFIDNNFQIAPVLRTLLKSAHFFDQEVHGARIKGPIEMMVGMLIEMHDTPDPDLYGLWAASGQVLGQFLLSPPNVAGWPGHHGWMNTQSVATRWHTTDLLLFGPRNQNPVDLTALAERLHDPTDDAAAFTLPTRLAEHFFAIDLEILDIADIEDDFAGDLVNNPLPDALLNAAPHVQNLAKMMLGPVPWYEWDLYADGAAQRLRTYVRTLALLPEFHLM